MSVSFAKCAKIVVELGFDNGVEIRIGGKNGRPKEERGKTVFRLIDRKISFESLLHENLLTTPFNHSQQHPPIISF